MIQIYNNLKIVSTYKKIYGGKNHTWAKCECLLCGNECHKMLSMIKIGHTKSCGCMKSSEGFTNRKNNPINYMDNLDSESVNYWAGFLFGDGCIDCTRHNRIQICLTNKNNSVEYLRKLSKFILETDCVKEYKKSNRCFLGITSKKLADNLSVFGIIPNKTYNSTLKIPNYKMARHVIRGYFDADGWFSIQKKYNKKYNTYYFSHTLGLCSYLRQNIEIVSNLLPNHPSISKHGTTGLYSINVSKKSEIIDIINFIEPDDKSLCFNYKWDKLWKFKNDYNKWLIQDSSKKKWDF